MKIIKRKLGQETPLVWCGGEGVKNVVEKGLQLKGVDDEDVSSALCAHAHSPFLIFFCVFP
jgi:hypothetical protein